MTGSHEAPFRSGVSFWTCYWLSVSILVGAPTLLVLICLALPDPWQRFERGEAHHSAGRYEEAIADYEWAEGVISPLDGGDHVLLRIADCKERLGDLAGAHEALQRLAVVRGQAESEQARRREAMRGWGERD